MSATIKKSEKTFLARNKQVRTLLKSAIEKQGISVADLARKMKSEYTGIHPYVKGNKDLSFRMIAKFEDALGINLIYIPKTVKKRK